MSSFDKNNVIVLFDGYSSGDTADDTTLENCTCTLVIGKESKIIVDTRTAWDGEEIALALHDRNINIEDITHVVCTHGHSDHIGSNYLFLHAKQHIVAGAISKKDKYQSIEDMYALIDDPTISENKHLKGFKIDDGIYVVPTPGHTLDSVSLIVGNNNLSAKPVAVVGDLYEKKEDCDYKAIWIGAGSESIEQQHESRLRIAELAGIIIPGHGPMFEVTSQIYAKVLQQSVTDLPSGENDSN